MQDNVDTGAAASRLDFLYWVPKEDWHHVGTKTVKSSVQRTPNINLGIGSFSLSVSGVTVGQNVEESGMRDLRAKIETVFRERADCPSVLNW